MNSKKNIRKSKSGSKMDIRKSTQRSEKHSRKFIENSILFYNAPKNHEKKLKALSNQTLEVMKGLRVLPRKVIQIQIDFVSAQTMKKMNFDFRGINSMTDIISFEQPLNQNIKGMCILGDLVICTDVMAKQARENKHSIEKEFNVLLVHGILHLLGHDHDSSPKGAQKMSTKEVKILKSLKITSGLILRSGLDFKTS